MGDLTILSDSLLARSLTWMLEMKTKGISMGASTLAILSVSVLAETYLGLLEMQWERVLDASRACDAVQL